MKVNFKSINIWPILWILKKLIDCDLKIENLKWNLRSMEDAFWIGKSTFWFRIRDSKGLDTSLTISTKSHKLSGQFTFLSLRQLIKYLSMQCNCCDVINSFLTMALNYLNQTSFWENRGQNICLTKKCTELSFYDFSFPGYIYIYLLFLVLYILVFYKI